MLSGMTKITSQLGTHHILRVYLIIYLPLFKPFPLSALFVLIGISIIVAGSFLTAFLWSVKSGQFDDDFTPSIRILFEDDSTSATDNTSTAPLNQNK
jgi:cbb3-type cytochrome oxidase maturation protein